MKNSFTLLEILLTIVISSVVIIYSLNFTKNLYLENEQSKNIEILKLDMMSTKIFLRKQNNIKNRLHFQNETLFFDNSILLKDVKKFDIQNINEKIEIKINLNNQIEQSWIF